MPLCEPFVEVAVDASKQPVVIGRLRCNPGLQISPDQSFNFHCQPRRIVAGIKSHIVGTQLSELVAPGGH
jgi:hypothetical protein